jgi:predicted nucleic acid-binding Zn ribbon protein
MTEGFHAPTEHDCPQCGRRARRQLSLPAVIFKGSGFYSTDNRQSGRRNGSSSGDGADTPAPAAAADASGHGHSHDPANGHSHGGEAKAETAATE